MPPILVGMEFVRYVHDAHDIPCGAEPTYTWSVYLSHDPCRDGLGIIGDCTTVIAFHRWNSTFKIIGRALPWAYALRLAQGEI